MADDSTGCAGWPSRRYWPGVNARPDADAIARWHAEAGRAGSVWAAGLTLLDRGYYWEAHEVLEPLWRELAPNSRERALVQGVIHLTNAALKHCQGAGAARERILGRATGSMVLAWPSGAHALPVLGLARDHCVVLLDSRQWLPAPAVPPVGDWSGVLPGAGLSGALCG